MDLSVGISTLSISFMAISAVLSIFAPIALIVFFGIKKKFNWKAALFGALFFIVFALILERIMHVLVLGKDPTQSVIYKNTIFYMLYGGFAAGIFEETARLLCFKYVLKIGENERVNTGISYGLGHGGIEAMILGGLSAIGNLALSVMSNEGMLNGAMAAMDEQQLDVLNKGIDTLANTQSYMFLMPGVERMIALVLQIALSMFVFKAVREKKWQFFLYAVLIHAGVDMIAVLYQKVSVNIFLFEGFVLLVTVLVAAAAFKITKSTPVPQQNDVEYPTK